MWLEQRRRHVLLQEEEGRLRDPNYANGEEEEEEEEISSSPYLRGRRGEERYVVDNRVKMHDQRRLLDLATPGFRRRTSPHTSPRHATFNSSRGVGGERERAVAGREGRGRIRPFSSASPGARRSQQLECQSSRQFSDLQGKTRMSSGCIKTYADSSPSSSFYSPLPPPPPPPLYPEILYPSPRPVSSPSLRRHEKKPSPEPFLPSPQRNLPWSASPKDWEPDSVITIRRCKELHRLAHPPEGSSSALSISSARAAEEEGEERGGAEKLSPEGRRREEATRGRVIPEDFERERSGLQEKRRRVRRGRERGYSAGDQEKEEERETRGTRPSSPPHKLYRRIFSASFPPPPPPFRGDARKSPSPSSSSPPLSSSPFSYSAGSRPLNSGERLKTATQGAWRRGYQQAEKEEDRRVDYDEVDLLSGRDEFGGREERGGRKKARDDLVKMVEKKLKPHSEVFHSAVQPPQQNARLQSILLQVRTHLRQHEREYEEKRKAREEEKRRERKKVLKVTSRRQQHEEDTREGMTMMLTTPRRGEKEAGRKKEEKEAQREEDDEEENGEGALGDVQRRGRKRRETGGSSGEEEDLDGAGRERKGEEKEREEDAEDEKETKKRGRPRYRSEEESRRQVDSARGGEEEDKEEASFFPSRTMVGAATGKEETLVPPSSAAAPSFCQELEAFCRVRGVEPCSHKHHHPDLPFYHPLPDLCDAAVKLQRWLRYVYHRRKCRVSDLPFCRRLRQNKNANSTANETTLGQNVHGLSSGNPPLAVLL